MGRVTLIAPLNADRRRVLTTYGTTSSRTINPNSSAS
jgi:hypothetical protein